MRQNGRVCITGNTKAQNRVTYSICGASMSDETEADSMGWKREELPSGPRTVTPKALTSPQAEPILVEAEMLAPKGAPIQDSKDALPPVGAPVKQG